MAAASEPESCLPGDLAGSNAGIRHIENVKRPIRAESDYRPDTAGRVALVSFWLFHFQFPFCSGVVKVQDPKAALGIYVNAMPTLKIVNMLGLFLQSVKYMVK